MGHGLTSGNHSPTWKRAAGSFGAVALGAVLLVAAWSKAIAPESFVEQIRLEGLDFFGLAAPIAHFALAIEIALGVALVLGLRRLWVLLPALGLVAFFLFLTGRAYWRFELGLIGEADGCGCFGNLLTRTPAEAFWQDLFLLALPAGLAFLARPKGEQPLPTRRLAIVSVVTAAGVVLGLWAPRLPLDDLATRLRPGVGVEQLCAGGGDSAERVCLDVLLSELGHGRHWVVISELEEESFLAAIARLNQLALAGSDFGLWVVTAASPETVSMFNWTHAPAFELREAPKALLRPLYRRLPRSFLVDDGEVVETRSGLPPMPISGNLSRTSDRGRDNATIDRQNES